MRAGVGILEWSASWLGTSIGLESPLDFFALTHCSRCQPNDLHDNAGEEQRQKRSRLGHDAVDQLDGS